MRYRRLDVNGDMVFGHGRQDFLIDSSATVAQAILTRLRLFAGEWFLDTTAGTPWNTQVLGTGTSSTYDQAIKTVILQTQGVLSIVNYSSTLNRGTRALSIQVTVNTQFGQTGNLSLTTKVPLGYGVGPFGLTPFGV